MSNEQQPAGTGIITYQHISSKPFSIKVFLAGRPVGMIRRDDAGLYYYAPRKNREEGERFPTVEAVKLSIEGR